METRVIAARGRAPVVALLLAACAAWASDRGAPGPEAGPGASSHRVAAHRSGVGTGARGIDGTISVHAVALGLRG